MGKNYLFRNIVNTEGMMKKKATKLLFTETASEKIELGERSIQLI